MNHPLRLAIGSHRAGSGKGCAMNVISWENGDTVITDMPRCADRMLARIVQRVNDSLCRHTSDDMLCPDCSVKVLALGHRTVGTGDLDLTDDQRHRVWVGVAADQARQVLHLARDKAKAEAYIVMAEAYSAGGPKPDAAADAYAAAAADAAAAAAAAAYAAAAAAAYAAAAADAYAAAYADAAAAADAYADAAAAAAADADAYAYAYADAAAAAAAAARLRLAHRAIDTFEHLTGHIAPTPIEDNTIRAYQLMTARA